MLNDYSKKNRRDPRFEYVETFRARSVAIFRTTARVARGRPELRRFAPRGTSSLLFGFRIKNTKWAHKLRDIHAKLYIRKFSNYAFRKIP